MNQYPGTAVLEPQMVDPTFAHEAMLAQELISRSTATVYGRNEAGQVEQMGETVYSDESRVATEGVVKAVVMLAPERYMDPSARGALHWNHMQHLQQMEALTGDQDKQTKGLRKSDKVTVVNRFPELN
jgi:hypothetical protein